MPSKTILKIVEVIRETVLFIVHRSFTISLSATLVEKLSSVNVVFVNLSPASVRIIGAKIVLLFVACFCCSFVIKQKLNCSRGGPQT